MPHLIDPKELPGFSREPVQIAQSEAPSGVLQSDSHPSSVTDTTPRKRRKRGPSMSRRSGQLGYEEKSGNWYVVRFWMDVPGREKRQHKRKRICPIKGPGALSASERLRKRKEIIAASGADTVEHFEKCHGANNGVTFRSQSEEWLNHMRTRKRKPVALATLKNWENCVQRWLNPHLGDLPLSGVDNDPVRELVSKMVEAGLSPKTISNYIQVVKSVVASAKDQKTRKHLYPVVWDYDYLDLPVVNRSEQRRPVFTGETVTGIVAGAMAHRQKESRRIYPMLYVLCAASGLRIGEVLGIDIANISADRSTIRIVQKAQDGRIENFLKTPSGLREIDLQTSVAAMLGDFIGSRISGLVFCTRNGEPLSVSNILRRSLHPLLAQMNQPKAGIHAFRRFRMTQLRKNSVPRDLENFWMGHAPETVGDLYSKLSEDVEFRKKVAESVGLGFEIPPRPASVVPNVPKSDVEAESEVAVSC